MINPDKIHKWILIDCQDGGMMWSFKKKEDAQVFAKDQTKTNPDNKYIVAECHSYFWGERINKIDIIETLMGEV